MQNELSLDEGREGANDEGKDESLAPTSQIVPHAPPPPPSLDPSSSSSIPLVGQQPAQALLATQKILEDSSVASRFAQLFSLVGQLKSENQAQQSSIARLSSENASLKSEVASLKRTNEDQDKLNGELARAAIPGGFWVWESLEDGIEGKEGRWLWSLEKYKVLPPSTVASGSPTSLLSLPVELLSLIFDLLDWDDQLAPCRVSYRILEVASKLAYGDHILLDADGAYLFVEARIRFFGSPTPNAFKDLVDLASNLTLPPSSLPVKVIAVQIPTFDAFQHWQDILRFVDPLKLNIDIGKREIPPTVRFVPSGFVASFASHWTRLKIYSSFGPESVLMVEGTACTSVFEECLQRCDPSLVARCQLRTGMVDGSEKREEVPSQDVLSLLARPFAGDGNEEWIGFDFMIKQQK